MKFDSRVVLAASLACSAVPAAPQDKAEPPSMQREIIPGSELMTSRERERYRERMRGASTAKDQTEVREQHVKQMRERARLRGLALPEPQQRSAP